MTSLISSALKSTIESVFDDLHDTFARDIYVYQQQNRVIISTNQNYNFLYGNAGSSAQSVTDAPVTQTISARIKYINADEDFSVMDGTSRVSLPAGSVRIKIPTASYSFLKDAKRIEFDGKIYILKSFGNPIGMFSVNYYSFFLIPLDDE